MEKLGSASPALVLVDVYALRGELKAGAMTGADALTKHAADSINTAAQSASHRFVDSD